MNKNSGVVLARDDGLIEVIDAVPVPAEQQRQIDAICALLVGGGKQQREEED